MRFSKDLTVISTGVVTFSYAEFGSGAGPVYFDNVDCSGSESNLTDCSHSSFISCNNGQGAGVRCQGRVMFTCENIQKSCQIWSLLIARYSQHQWQLYLWRCSSGWRLQSV